LPLPCGSAPRASGVDRPGAAPMAAGGRPDAVGSTALPSTETSVTQDREGWPTTARSTTPGLGTRTRSVAEHRGHPTRCPTFASPTGKVLAQTGQVTGPGSFRDGARSTFIAKRPDIAPEGTSARTSRAKAVQ